MNDIAANPSSWTFLSNHGHVLICLALNMDDTMREIAHKVGITERAVQRIVTDLEDAGVVTRERCGRRNRYRLNLDTRLRHPIESSSTVGDLVAMVLKHPHTAAAA